MNVEDSVLLLVDHQSSFFHTATASLRRRFAARLPGFVALMKPRVMSLAVFTAFVGMTIAPGHLDPFLGSVAIVAIAAGAGAAGVLNMWCDADIDAVMARTAGRPIPRGEISRAERLYSGLSLPAAPSRSLLLRSISKPPPCSPLRSSSMSSCTRCG
jgi:heme O synthase-like polyprenyltransferase